MKKTVPVVLLICALVAGLFSIFGEDGYKKLSMLRRTLATQIEKNAEEAEEVSGLKRRVNGLHSNARVLEKAARNELGMARSDEMIFIFEKSS